MLKRLVYRINKLVYKLLNPRWIVNENGELGIRILWLNLLYYKWPDPTLCTEYKWRVINKREFGDTIKNK